MPKVDFFKLSPERQAKEIEKMTEQIVSRLPTLKKRLQMYSETSSELYNLKSDELELMGTTYARAVRGGEISTPSSQQAYKQFIGNLKKYTRTSISELAKQTAQMRMEDWLLHIQNASNETDKAYAKKLYDSMTEEEKEGFTRSKYFMDSSHMYIVTEEDNVQYSIQTLKLELYLEEVRKKKTDHIYRTKVKGDEGKLRKYTRRKKRG